MPSGIGGLGGSNCGTPQKPRHRAHSLHADQTVSSVLKAPVRLLNRTPAPNAAAYGDINVNVRLLTKDYSGRRKLRVAQPIEPSENTAHFKLYHVQRRGEESAKLVAGRIITPTVKDVCQRPTSYGLPEWATTSQEIPAGDTPQDSHITSQSSGFSALAPTEGVGRFEAKPSCQKDAPRSRAETSSCQADLGREKVSVQQQRVFEEEHAGGEKTTSEQLPDEACASPCTLIPSVLSSFAALCPPSHSAANVGKTQLQEHPRRQGQSTVPCVEYPSSNGWTPQVFQQRRPTEAIAYVPPLLRYNQQGDPSNRKDESFSSVHLPQIAELPPSPIAQSDPLLCCTGMHGAADSAQGVQKLTYGQPARSTGLPPVMQSPRSPAALDVAVPVVPHAASRMHGPDSPFKFKGCMASLIEACGGWSGAEAAAGGVASDIHRQPELDVEGLQLHGGETQTASQSHSLQREYGMLKQPSSLSPAGGLVKPSPVLGGAIEGGPEEPSAVQQGDLSCTVSTTERIPSRDFTDESIRLPSEADRGTSNANAGVRETSSHCRLETSSLTSKIPPLLARGYAVFMPERTRLDNQGRRGVIPVRFKVLHCREARSQPQAGTKYSTSQGPYRQIFHFRVLQRQRPRDEENRRLVTFKAPTHCGARRVSSGSPQRHLHATHSRVRPYSTCLGMPERLTSDSSTSSLVTIQYVHQRSYRSLPGSPVSEARREPQKLLRKGTVSRFASRIAQETIRRVAERRAAWSASAKASKPATKQAAQHYIEQVGAKKPRRAEKIQTSVDALWCCVVKNDRAKAQQSSVGGKEQASYPPSIQSKDIEISERGRRLSTPRATEKAASAKSKVKVEVFQSQSSAPEEACSALPAESLCMKVGSWLTSRGLTWNMTKTKTDLSSLPVKDAVEDACSEREEQTLCPDEAISKLDLGFISCCKLAKSKKSPLSEQSASSLRFTSDGYPGTTGSCEPTPLVTQTESTEGMHSPRAGIDYPRADPEVVAPPLYSLPVVHFLPPVFEPLPVIETASDCSSLESPTCCLAVPSAPVQMCLRPTADHRDSSSGKEFSQALNLPTQWRNCVRICLLPAREPVVHP